MSELIRRDGPTNMALDAELLAGADAGKLGFRVYGWDGPWVSLGCFQRPETALRPNCPIPWAIRPTGGKAVLHGHDITLGFAIPLAVLGDPAALSRSLRGVYRRAIQPIVAALRTCGLPAILAEDLLDFNRRRDRSEGKLADCFTVISANDVVLESTGAKVCGCALKMTQSAVLVQASIPAGPPLVDPAEVFEHPATIVATRWETARFEGAFREAMASLEGRMMAHEIAEER